MVPSGRSENHENDGGVEFSQNENEQLLDPNEAE